MARKASKSLETEKVTTAILEILRSVGGDVVGLSIRDLWLSLRSTGIKVAEYQVRSLASKMVD